jgi:hypothetical protein
MSDAAIPQALAAEDRRALAGLRRLFPESEVEPTSAVGDYEILLPTGAGLLDGEIASLDEMGFVIEMIHNPQPTDDRTYAFAVIVTDTRVS